MQTLNWKNRTKKWKSSLTIWIKKISRAVLLSTVWNNSQSMSSGELSSFFQFIISGSHAAGDKVTKWRFASKEFARKVFSQKSKLAGSSIFVSEVLAKRIGDLLNAARDPFGVKHLLTDCDNILMSRQVNRLCGRQDPLVDAFETVVFAVFSLSYIAFFFFCSFYYDFFLIFVIFIIIFKNCRFSVLYFLFLFFSFHLERFVWFVYFSLFLVFSLLFSKIIDSQYSIFFFTFFFSFIEICLVRVFIYCFCIYIWLFNEPTFSSRRGFVGSSSNRT